MVILKMGIVTFLHNSQTGGNGALADGENRPGQQDLRVFPNGPGKNGRNSTINGNNSTGSVRILKTSFGEGFFFSLRGLSFCFQ